MSKNVVTLKSGSEVTQGHGNLSNSIVTLSLRQILKNSTCNYAVTLKPGLGVTQGHRNRHVSIRHLWFPINVP